MRSKISSLLAFILLFGMLTPIGSFGTTAYAASVPVLQNGFEDGTVGDWKPFNCGGGTVKAAVTSDVAATGSKSLQLSGRPSKDCSPSIDLNAFLKEGHTYDISLKVRLGQGIDQAHVTMNMSNQTNNYPWIMGNQAINDQNWTTFSTTSYARPSGTDSMTLYVETVASAADVFIDDVLIVDTTPPVKTTVLSNGFEDGAVGNWKLFNCGGGTAQTVVSSVYAATGTKSLQLSGRGGVSCSPSIDLNALLKEGHTYDISLKVRLGQGIDQAHVTMNMSNQTNNYPWIMGNQAINDQNWTTFSMTSYTRPTGTDSMTLYVETVASAADIFIDDVLIVDNTSDNTPVQTDLAKLKDVYKDYFKIGAALEPNQLEGNSRELLDMHFSSIVAENAMKPGSINSIKGTYNFAGADRLAQYARDNKEDLRFHTLVWHSQAADWMFEDDDAKTLSPTPENKELVLQRLKDYLGAVVPRYADVATDWDVVNEVIDEGRPNGMRNTLWYQLTGEDFIKVAFTETRRLLNEMYAKDPVKYAVAKNSKLIINDYGTHNPQKAKFLLDLIKRLKAEGVPIDGVGHQTHINISGPSIQQISDSIKMFGEAGLDNQLTELDVSVYTNDKDSYQNVPQDLLAKQGYRFKELFDELKRLDDMGRTAGNPEGWISNVTFWGIADDHTWLHNRPVTRQDAPFAFDKNYLAKPAYWGMVDPSKLTLIKKEANSANGTPKLNNVDDLVWNTVLAIPLEKSGSLEAAMKILWDENNLYVKAIVKDKSKLSGDKVDLFVKDGDQIKSVQVARGAAGTVETDNGYTLVAAIALSGSTVGSKVSFDIRVTDSGSDDGSEHGLNGSISSWSDLGNNQDANSNGYGILTLIPATKISTVNYGTPVLDGDMDAIWANATKLTTDVKVEGGEGSKADFYTMWDDKHLYVYAVVTDKKLSDASPNPWEHDSIEIFIDQNNGKTSSYEADDGQYRINYKNVRTVGGHASHTNYTSVTKSVYGDGGIATGYIVAAAIDLDMITPVNGTVIGFDLQVNNDDNGTGKRDSVWIWNDPTGKSYENTSRFGVLVLEGKPNGGGSGGGNTGGSITPSNPGVINATVDANGNAKVLINAADFKGAISESKAGLLKFQADGADKAKQISITLPVDQVQAAKAAGIKTVQIGFGMASVQLPVSLFEGAASSASVELTVNKINPESLSAAVRAEIGSNTVYDFNLSVGGKVISLFGEGQSVGVSLPYTLKTGENPNQIIIYYITDDGKLEVIKNGRYNSNTGMVQFNATHFSKYAAVSIEVGFKDVASIAWANDSIIGLAARGIVNGVSAQSFAPNRSVTRAEFVQMLIQTLDLEQAGASSTFRDVKEGAWYYNSIASAQKLGIVSGLVDGSFGINDKISRQDMASMVYRAIQKTTISLDTVNDKAEFNDDAAIAAYAKEAVTSLQTAGIINGIGNGSFAPHATATRAQAAVILYQILQKIMI